MDSKFIGNITELEVLTYITKLGYQVSIPFGDRERYDQIWDINGSACYHYQRIKLVVSKLTSYLFDLTNNYTSISYAQTRYDSLWEKGDCAAG